MTFSELGLKIHEAVRSKLDRCALFSKSRSLNLPFGDMLALCRDWSCGIVVEVLVFKWVWSTFLVAVSMETPAITLKTKRTN